MPTTDTYGQGIQLASLTDAPDIPGAIKALADGVIPRGVLSFASGTERGATLYGPDRAPVEGMLTWLRDVNRLDLFDGTNFVAVSTGASAWTTINLVSPFTQNGNTNGTLQYRLLNISGEESLQLRGAIGRSSYPASPAYNTIINSTPLPSIVRPSTLRTVLIPCSDQSSDRISMKLDVQTDGYLQVFGFTTTTKPPWIGFNGVIVSL